MNTNNILLTYFLDYPILNAGWLASPEDKNKPVFGIMSNCNNMLQLTEESPINKNYCYNHGCKLQNGKKMENLKKTGMYIFSHLMEIMEGF